MTQLPALCAALRDGALDGILAHPEVCAPLACDLTVLQSQLLFNDSVQ